MELIISVKKSDPRKDFGTDMEDDEFLHRFIDASHINDLKKILYDYLLAEMKENASKKESTHSGVITKAMRYIDQNYSNNISLNDVAESINMSYFYFSRLFKESTGKSFSDYLTEYRIDKSIELMKDENLSIKQISYDIGYNDPNYFSKIFKKLKGITPTDYRGRM
jgi:two-component system response regulator YesN